jgi:phosphatidylinositol-3-phosphatase
MSKEGLRRGYAREVLRQVPHQSARSSARAATWVVCCLALAACASGSAARTTATTAAAPNGSSPLSADAAGSVSAAPATPTPTGSHRPKVLVVMEENHSQSQVFPGHMPYLWSLARRYGHATAYRDLTHPSLPNYLAVVAGSTFGDPQDCTPGPGCTFPGPTVFGQAVAAGGTARSYVESMAAPCQLDDRGEYDVNHNPWAYFPSEAALCAVDDVPLGTVRSGPLLSDVRSGSLPSVGMVTPNLQHDGHDGTLAQADAWLRAWVPVLMSGPDWQDGRLTLVITFDEGETTEVVPFVLIAPHVSGAVVGRPLDHYALTRLLDQAAGGPALRAAARAARITTLFGLPAALAS